MFLRPELEGRGDALIRVRHWARSAKVKVFLLGDLKACGFDQVINLAIEMTPASNPFPDWCYSVLPSSHSGIHVSCSATSE